MWRNDDYRVMIRHRRTFSRKEFSIVMQHMLKSGQIQHIDRKAFEKAQAVTQVVLQRKVVDRSFKHEVVGWASLATGYAVCSKEDMFSRADGRAVAFERALDVLQARIENDEVDRCHYQPFSNIFDEHCIEESTVQE